MTALTYTDPTLSPVKRVGSIAGQTTYQVVVTYPGEAPNVIVFNGMIGETGGPIVMVTPGNPRGMFVSDPGRHGPFGPEWVTRFFTAR